MDEVRIEYWIVDEGVIIATGDEEVPLPGGAQVFEDDTIDPDGALSFGTFDQAYVKVSFLNDNGDPIDPLQGNIDTLGVRIINFETTETETTVIPPDNFSFTLTAEDGDTDMATTGLINVTLDPLFL